MNLVVTTSKISERVNYWMALFILAGVIGGILAFSFAYISAANVMIGLCLFPFVIFVEGGTRFNWVYFIALAGFCFLALVYNIKIFYFFTLAFYFILILELFLGKINKLVLFLIVLMSPVFLQISVILGFPIRLLLSTWASSILSVLGLNVQADGNMMQLNGYTFTVDEACMGLSMLAISMLMGVFILIHHYKATRKKLSLLHLIGFFLVLFCLNITANLFRIVTLVLFKILPENPMHELTGILCMIFYTMIPLYFLGKWMIERVGKFTPTGFSPAKSPSSTLLVSLAAISILIISAGIAIDPERTEAESPHARVHMPGMIPQQINGGITKMVDDHLLIYVKPIPEFFTGEHTPLICWKGSGYAFKKVKKQWIAGHEVFTGILFKDKVMLHTAWWYTNGKIETIDQLTWRGAMLQGGERFCLVNVTANDETILTENLQKIFRQRLLNIN